MRALVGVILTTSLLAVTLGACGDDGESDTACSRAMEAAASVDEMSDTPEDFLPTVRACENLDEWTSEARATGALEADVDPVVFAYGLCSGTPAVEGETVCVEAVAADPLGLEQLEE